MVELEVYLNMTENNQLLEVRINLKVLEKSFSNFKDQLYEKQFGESQNETKHKNNKILKQINNEDFYLYMLFHTYLFYSKNRFLQDHGNTKYESVPYNLKNLNENKKMTLSNINENYEGVIKLTKWDRVFLISNPMVNFCNDFIENRMFNIPMSYEDKIEELSLKLFDSKSIDELLKIKNEIKTRLKAGNGFYQIYNISNNNIKQFHSLVRKSMLQFYYTLPTDNPVFDRVSKNALNIVSPGSASGWNKDVEKAVNKAKSDLNIEFEYDSGGKNGYASFSINLPPKKYEENTDVRIQIILEELQKNHREFKKENWRPFSSMNLVLVLKNSALQLGGYIFIFELNRALKIFLANASKKIPIDLLISRFGFKDGKEYDIFDFQQTYEFSGAQAEYDKYEIKFLEFIEKVYDTNNYSVDNFTILGKILEQQYLEYKENVNIISPDDNVHSSSNEYEFFNNKLESRVIDAGQKSYEIFKKFRNFIEKLEDPIHTEITFIEIILFYTEWCKKFND